MVKEILLTKGFTAIVDDVDYVQLPKRWQCLHRKWTYAVRRVREGKGKRSIYLHRLIWEMHNGPIPPGMEIDHINGNRLDDRLVNLRMCTCDENHFNRHAAISGSSKFKGVSWDKNNEKWSAKIKYAGKTVNLGRFSSETKAALAYNRKAIELHGIYARINCVEEVLG